MRYIKMHACHGRLGINKTLKLCRFGHLARIGEDRTAFRGATSIPGGKRIEGRLRRR